MTSTAVTNSNFYSANNTRYVVINGYENDTLDKCYATLKQQLNFPDYFGNNLDALEDVMNDLEWVPEEKVVIIILHLISLLKNEEEEKRESFFEIMESHKTNKEFSLIYVGDTTNETD
jgi:RNAse (barnase) inhibitor barstar